jgi:hypothetical protein
MKKTLFLAVPSIALAAYFFRSQIEMLWKKYTWRKPVAASNWMMAEISNNETLKKMEPILKKEVETTCNKNYDYVVTVEAKILDAQCSQLSKFFARLFAMRLMRLLSSVLTYSIGRNKEIIKSFYNIQKIREAILEIIDQYMPVLLKEVATVITQMNEESNNLYHGNLEAYLTSILNIIELQACSYEEIPNEPSKHKAIKILQPLYKIAMDYLTKMPALQNEINEVIDYIFTNYFQSLFLEGVREDAKYLGANTVIKPINQLFNKANTLIQITDTLLKQLTCMYFMDESNSSSLAKIMEMVFMPPTQNAKAKRVQYNKNLRSFTHYILFHKADYQEEDGMVQDFDNMANFLTKLII